MSFWDDLITAVNKIEWSFESRDPVWAWTVVAMYAIAAIIVFKAYLSSQKADFPESIRKKCRVFWLFLFVLMLFLAFNKQLDLQTYVTAVMREVARSEGWYGERRIVQKEGIIVLGLIAFLILTYLIYIIYHLPLSYKVTMAGVMCTFAFIGMRASSFHHFDIFAAHEIYGVKLHILVEILGGIVAGTGGLLSIRGVKFWESYYREHYKGGQEKIITPQEEIETGYVDVSAEVVEIPVDNVICEIIDKGAGTVAGIADICSGGLEIECVEGVIVNENYSETAISDAGDSKKESNNSYTEYARAAQKNNTEEPAGINNNFTAVKSEINHAGETGENKSESTRKKSPNNKEKYWIQIDEKSSGWL